MKRKNTDLLVSFDHLDMEDRWRACLNALNNEYTLSMKDMCKLLKCSRSWATRYLLPHLHYIYLSNGAGKGKNYVGLASLYLNEKIKESCWYSKSEFETLIKNHITDISRQTIVIPIEKIIDEEKLDEFLNNYISRSEIRKRFSETGDYKEYTNTLEKMEEFITECLDYRYNILWLKKASAYYRSKSIAVNCTLDNINISKLMAVHDIKDYGDTDEEVYRDLFRDGCCRLVLELPDSDGVISNKIYYYKPDDHFDFDSTKEKITVNYSDYISLFNNI